MLRIFFLLILLAPSAFAAGNIENSEYIGSWTNTHLVTKGESNTLEITEQYRVSLSRSFSNGSADQQFTTDINAIQFVDDLAIIELHWDGGELAYKLVLSGWTSSSRRMIFGTIFMYRDGDLINGLPISFETKN